MELVRLSSQEEQQIAASNVFCLITQDDKINIREANSTEPCSALECVLSPMWGNPREERRDYAAGGKEKSVHKGNSDLVQDSNTTSG